MSGIFWWFFVMMFISTFVTAVMIIYAAMYGTFILLWLYILITLCIACILIWLSLDE